MIKILIDGITAVLFNVGLIIIAIYTGYILGLAIGSLTYEVLGLDSPRRVGNVFAWASALATSILTVYHISKAIERTSELEQMRKIKDIFNDFKED